MEVLCHVDILKLTADVQSMNREVYDPINRMITNPNKTEAFVARRYRTVDPPHGDLVLSGDSIRTNPNFDNFGVKFDS